MWLLFQLSVQAQDMTALWDQQRPYQVRNDALNRMEAGDRPGARDRFQYLADQQALGPQPSYYLGLLAELEEDYPTAVSHYQKVVSEWPTDPKATDARFRLALCLQDAGRLEESQDAVIILMDMGAWDPQDQLSLSLVGATADLDLRASKRHRRNLAELLDQARSFDELSWVRARGHAAQVTLWLEDAQRIRIKGNRRAARRLVKRASKMKASEEEIITIAGLDEPEYVLEGLIALGDAYHQLHEDLLAAPPPRRFGEEKRAIYQRLLEERITVLKTKAWRAYDQGFQLALRIGWQGSATEVLRDRRNTVDLS